MKKLTALICAVLILISGVCLSESESTIALARAVYALAGDQSADVQLAIATVAVNRVGSGWFPDTLGEVLAQQQQFPAGDEYDEASLNAAYAAIRGDGNLPVDVLYFHAQDASFAWDDEYLYCVKGNFGFYVRSGEF